MSSLGRRILSGMVLVAALLAATFLLPSWIACTLLLALGLLGAREFYRLLDAVGMPAFRMFGMSAGLVVLAVPLVRGYLAGHLPDAWLATFQDLDAIVFSFILLVICVRQFPAKHNPQPLATIAGTLMGVLYVPFLLGFVGRILFLPSPLAPGTPPTPLQPLASPGRDLVLFLIVVVKSSDIGAFVVGRRFGRHKLFPRISPGKTWEGLAGGLSLGTLAGLGFMALQPSTAGGVWFGDLPMHWGDGLALGLILSAMGVIGDLIESLLKRAAGAKDSGGSIPGMGGVLDVLDSLLFTAPVMYVYALWFLE